MPDMAHHLYGNIKKARNKNNNSLYFLRKDCEINIQQSQVDITSDGSPLDWEDLITIGDKVKIKALYKLLSISRKTNSYYLKDIVDYFWRRHANKLTKRFAHMFSKYEEIITSRMHGHILSCLVDTNNTLIDNSYGKNSGYYQQWTNKIPTAKLFSDSKK